MTPQPASSMSGVSDEPSHRDSAGTLLCNTEATSAPRSGSIGVLPIPQLSDDAVQRVRLMLAVHCPDCSNYGRIIGQGEEFRNVTKLVEPRFSCSVCSWGPAPHDAPQMWRVYYAGRLGGTLVWAVNEEHMAVLVRYLETNPKRRAKVEFPWEYKALMSRLPTQVISGRFRNDMVTLIKRLQQTRPHGV